MTRPGSYLERAVTVFHRARHSALLVGILGTGLRVGGNVVLIPLLGWLFSPEELTIWWVFLAFGALANLADFGFGSVVARVYSYLWAGADDFDAEGLRPPPQNGEPNLPRVRQFFITVRQLYWRLAIGATLLLGTVGTLFLAKPIRLSGSSAFLWSVWGAYVGVVCFNLGISHWQYACTGLNRMREVQAVNLWSGLGYLVVAIGSLLAGVGFPSLVAAILVRTLIARFLWRRTYLAAVPPTAAALRPDPSMVRRLWPNAYKFGVVSIGAFLLANGNIFVASRFLSAQESASYGLTAQVGVFLINFASLWLAVKWPELTILRTQGRLQEMARLFARRLTLTLLSFALAAILLMLLGNRLLEWRSTSNHFLPAPQLALYLGYLMIQLCYVQFGSLTYTENVMPFFRISLTTGLGMMALSLILTPRYGIWGLLCAPLVAESAYSSWYVVWRGFQGQPLSPLQFVLAALGKRL